MKYLKITEIINSLRKKRFKIFTTSDFAKLLGISKRKATLLLTRNTRKQYFTRLIKGVYCLTGDLPSTFSIANAVLRPSYISLDTALSYYKMIPETIYSVTSITTRHSRSIIISNMEYKYHQLAKKLYFGIRPIKENDSYIFMAEKEKALLDYLYFVANGKRVYNDRLSVKTIDKKRFSVYQQEFKKNIKNKFLLKKLESLIHNIK